MIRPTLDIAVEFNRSVRESDEWFDEPDELDRVESALVSTESLDDPLEVAATIAYRVTRAQGFTEGNKRTALLLAIWTLDRNGLDGSAIVPADDRELADLLVDAAAGRDVHAGISEYFHRHRGT